MTSEDQAVDAAGGAADAATQTVSRDELNEAINRRQSALDRARLAEEKLEKLKAAQVSRERAEKEEQGRFQELAAESEARASSLVEQLKAQNERLELLSNKHRQSITSRLEALPQQVRETLEERLGETPDLDTLETSVALAESLQTETRMPVPRNIGVQPSAGRVASISSNGKASVTDIAKMSRTEQAAYLRQNY